MAKQNFLKGGYVGKLGQTVGQRWKDKRIIRTYTKPRNPRTPAQQAMRQNFATANKLAQQAMNINGNQGIWDTSKAPEYSLRVGQAMRMLQAGVPPDQAVPLYPVAPEQKKSTTIKSVVDTGNDSIEITLTGYGQLPIASFKGVGYYIADGVDDDWYEYDIDEPFDSATGKLEIFHDAVGSSNSSSFWAIGLDLKPYDAQGNEIPTASVDWSYYAQDTVAVIPTQNFARDLQITGSTIKDAGEDVSNIRIQGVDPQEDGGTIFGCGWTYLTDVDDSNELITFSGPVDLASLPVDIETGASYDAAVNGIYAVCWYIYQKDKKVYCRTEIKDFTV